MLFSDPGFVFLFLPSVFIIFYLFYKYWSGNNLIILLITSSILFYSAEYSPYIFLIIGSIFFNYYTSQIVETYRERTRWPLILGISANLILLGWFKYAAFIADNLGRLFITDIDVPDIILPLAISFFTFQQIAYLVDVHRGDIKTGNLQNYALFVMFFPQLIAGPIVRYQEVVPQFSRLHARLKDRMGDIALGASFLPSDCSRKTSLRMNSAYMPTRCSTQLTPGKS